LIGFTYFLTARTFSPNNPRSFGYLIEAFGLSIFYLPMKSSDPNAFVFPLNGPAWSLFFEMAVNVLYAAFLQRLGTRALSAIIGLSATLLVISSLWYGHLDLGWNWPTLVAGFPRVTFSFFAGVLLYRLKPRSPRFATHPLLVLGLLIAALAIPYRSGGLSALVVLLGFPVLVAAASVTEPGRRLGPGFALLGAISYPIYALHDPLLAWINAALLHWHIDPSHRPWVGWAAIALVISASYLALRVWDEPTRKALTQRFRPGRRVGRPGHSRAASKQGLLSSIDALPKDNPDASLDG
jgi:peptidoglycan/LPS O-acetylase OafA/YrhL